MPGRCRKHLNPGETPTQARMDWKVLVLAQDSRSGSDREPARHISPDRMALLRGLPRLSARMAQLLVTGDTSGRYTTGDPDSDGWRITCALAAGAAQAGREWSEEQLWHALVLRPTTGGAWLRQLRGRKGDQAAREALRRAMGKAASLVAASSAFGGRADAAAELAEIRDLVAVQKWPSRAGGSNLKVLLAHLEQAERSGGREYTASLRQIAEKAGCARSTVQAAHARLSDIWFVAALPGGAVRGMGDPDGDQATVWRLRRPAEVRQRLVALDTESIVNVSGHPQPPQPRQGAGVPNTRVLAGFMANDAMHEYAHGTAGARILSTLDTTDGMSPQDLAEALGYHVGTIRRRLRLLAADELVTCADGLYYRPTEVTDAQLAEAAERRGTAGRGAARVWRHAQERARRRAYLEHLATRPRRGRVADPIVPLEAYDPETGEILPAQAHHWRGWDISDPWRPVWRGTSEAA